MGIAATVASGVAALGASAATAATIGAVASAGIIGVATSVGTSLVSNALTGGGSASGGGNANTNSPSSGGSINTTSPFYGLSGFQTAGLEPRASLQGGMGKDQEANTGISGGEMTMDKSPTKGAYIDPMSATHRTPANPEFAQNISKDTNDQWADRLSRYLDYNTRRLG